jgi:hypothetical protein
MKKITILTTVFLFLFISQIVAQENIEELVKAAPPRGKYPDASAVIVHSAQTFRLAAEGTKSEEFLRLVEVFNLRGREKFSDFRIPFDKNLETVDLLLAKTYKPNLSSVDVEKGAINDVSPPYLAEAEMYANILHRVLSFSAVDPGVCLAVHYKKENKEKVGNLDEIVFFQMDEPLFLKQLKIVIPAGKRLKSKIIGLKANFSEESAGTEKAYTLVSSDSPQIKPEDFMPPLAEMASRVVFSTYQDWNEASQAFSSSFFEAIKPSEEIRKLAEEMAKGASSQEEKIRKIFLFVAKEIRSIRLNFGEGGYSVHGAGTVLNNRYGDWKDKSAVLCSLLGAAGVEAFPVLANSEAVPLFEDIPALKQFDCVLVAIPQGDDYLFLNPFANDSLYGYFLEGKGAKGLVVKPDGVEFRLIHCLPGAGSVSLNEIKGELDLKGGIKGKISCEFSGFFDKMARQQLKDKTEKELQNFYTESVNKLLDEGEATKNSLSDPKDLTKKIVISQEFSGANFGIFQGEIMLINLPQVPYQFFDLPSMPRLAKRLYPFRLSDESEITSSVELKIPAGFKPLYFPEGYSFKKDYGEFALSSSFDSEKSTLKIAKTASFKKKDIALDQYEEFKKIIDSFGITKNNLILLEKK